LTATHQTYSHGQYPHTHHRLWKNAIAIACRCMQHESQRVGATSVARSRAVWFGHLAGIATGVYDARVRAR